MTQFNNPILPGFYPDPSICRVGEDYYLVTSTFSYFPGVPIFHSRDLVHWEQIGNILDRPEQISLEGGEHSKGIFAPTLRYHKGTFYMITTNVTRDGNFIVTAKDPKGPWSKPYFLGSNGIDPSLFFDDDDRCYYCGTQERREGSKYFGDNEIFIQELDLKTMKLTGPSYAGWHGALRNVVWPEGPHLFKKDGWYYLMISEAGTAHEHAVTIARSRDLTKPFEGYKSNPILTHRHLGLHYPIVNVGHPDIVETQNGEWWMVCLASRPYGGYFRNLGRETFLVPFTWENGWPLINPGKAIVEMQGTAPNLPEFHANEVAALDHFDNATLGMHYLYLRNPKPQNYSLSERPGYLRLKLAPEEIGELTSPTLVVRRQTTMNYELRTRLCFAAQSASESAGLVLMQSDDYNYQMIVTAAEHPSQGLRPCIQVILRKHGESEVVTTQWVEPSESYQLRIIQQEQSLCFSYSLEDDTWETILTNANASILCTDVAGGFVGTCLGIYASSHGQASDSVADFDYLYLA